MFEPTVQAHPAIRIVDVAQLGRGARQVSFACPHGSTTRILLPGKVPLREEVLRDLVSAVHGVQTGCGCAESLRQPIYDA